ncbi:S26 family signal peptidase [Planococcus halocryophilus]|uniref:S26 family signal peptidase n=1 Tax=Planococcus halocryophilus TaxID=1215089 RepID=UPI001F0E7187|nr:S26 family signal peptidase [Planococcus halocryophilus]MCH4826931.1 S26 family signal peptidase [Planococcus halocryophilus]
MNKFKRDIDDFIGKSPRFSKSLQRNMLFQIQAGERPHKFTIKKYEWFTYAAVFVILLTVVALFAIQIVNDKGRVPQLPSTGGIEKSVVTDTDPDVDIPVFAEYTQPLEIFEFNYDAMDRGNHEYAEYPLVINPLAYKDKKISRGDVVKYEYDFFDGMQETISRVIGLPGETIEILDGQIFVDEQKLNTFYGKAHRLGIGSLEEYNAWFEKNASPNSSTSGMEEIFQMSMEKIYLGEDEVFLIGDDWFRSSQHSLKVEAIQAEVLGYYKP